MDGDRSEMSRIQHVVVAIIFDILPSDSWLLLQALGMTFQERRKHPRIRIADDPTELKLGLGGAGVAPAAPSYSVDRPAGPQVPPDAASLCEVGGRLTTAQAKSGRPGSHPRKQIVTVPCPAVPGSAWLSTPALRSHHALTLPLSWAIKTVPARGGRKVPYFHSCRLFQPTGLTRPGNLK